ncbi:hypothetical protein F2Q69_00020603 [Brassica cretica]|uniref:Uncharacterized protein n=1 Tax=Brassica cretica TaxID=69181 RepID=A0A8S9Q7L4_BRACR|nr:hypothetical protein F2Q69_00020603 [Brassica cretica]
MIRKSPESLVFVTVGNVSHHRRDPSKGDHDLSLFLAPPPSLTLDHHIRLCVSILGIFPLSPTLAKVRVYSVNPVPV